MMANAGDAVRRVSRVVGVGLCLQLGVWPRPHAARRCARSRRATAVHDRWATRFLAPGDAGRRPTLPRLHDPRAHGDRRLWRAVPAGAGGGADRRPAPPHRYRADARGGDAGVSSVHARGGAARSSADDRSDLDREHLPARRRGLDVELRSPVRARTIRARGHALAGAAASPDGEPHHAVRGGHRRRHRDLDDGGLAGHDPRGRSVARPDQPQPRRAPRRVRRYERRHGADPVCDAPADRRAVRGLLRPRRARRVPTRQLPEDCSRLYFSGLDSVFYAPQR